MSSNRALTNESSPLSLIPISGEQAQFEFSQLLGACFPVPEGGSFLDDFPVWREELGAKVSRFGVRGPAGWMAAAAIRVVNIRLGPGRNEKIGLIGAVCTHPDARGNGLGTRLLDELEAIAAAQGAGAICLWGQAQDLYERRGYRLVGKQWRIPASSLELSKYQPPSNIGRGWHPGLLKLLQQSPLGVALEGSDEAWISRHLHMDWRWTGKGGVPTAVIAMDKGIDLVGMIHTWGGDPEGVRALLSQAARERVNNEERQLLCHPELVPCALKPGSVRFEEPLCLAKPLAKPAILEDRGLWFWGVDSC